MNKQAITRYPIHEFLSRRWSPRAFSSRMVEKEKLLSLFEAARWAPSCFNEQPWAFIVATRENPSDHERLLNCLVDSNIRWAREAPVLMLSVAKLQFDHNHKPNRHALHDVGLAAASLIVQGTALGLYAHQMAGFHEDRARKVFGIPESYAPVAGIALGYMGDPEQLPGDLCERELSARKRKPLDDMIFSESWNQSSPLL